MRLTVTLLVAAARGGVIGRGTSIPWRLKGDMKHFREYTTGKVLLCGRKTYDTFPPHKLGTLDRKMIVLSRNGVWFTVLDHVQVAGDVDSAILRAEDLTIGKEERELVVLGGSEIYRKFLPLASRIVMTHVEGSTTGDRFFPEVQLSEWLVRPSYSSFHPRDANNDHDFTINVYERASR